MASSSVSGQEEIPALLKTLPQAKSKLHREVSSLSSLQVETNKLTTTLRNQNSVSDPLRSSQYGLKPNPEFTLFPKLPVELQTRILEIACYQEPRVVKLYISCEYDDSGKLLYEFYCSGNCTPPILHASPITRRIVLKYGWYAKRQVDFSKAAVKFSDSEDRSDLPRSTYFNFDIDILYFVEGVSWSQNLWHDNWAEIVTKHRTLRKFHRVAIRNHTIDFDRNWSVAANFLSKSRSRIEEVIVVREIYDRGIRLGETTYRLVPWADDDTIFRYDSLIGPIRITVKGNEGDILELLASAESDGEDGEIVEDEMEEDGGDRAWRAGVRIPIKVTHMALEEIRPFSMPRIYLG